MKTLRDSNKRALTKKITPISTHKFLNTPQKLLAADKNSWAMNDSILIGNRRFSSLAFQRPRTARRSVAISGVVYSARSATFHYQQL